jgi:hypothetical protein
MKNSRKPEAYAKTCSPYAEKEVGITTMQIPYINKSFPVQPISDYVTVF